MPPDYGKRQLISLVDYGRLIAAPISVAAYQWQYGLLLIVAPYQRRDPLPERLMRRQTLCQEGRELSPVL
jgi:hypothetical protein